MNPPQQTIHRIITNIETIIKGQSQAVRIMVAGLISGGHILLEDYPGTGKTTMAKVLAKSINTTYKRVQFTPDLLPSDILGVSIYDQSKKIFKLHKGPIFTNILLADEINRASPRTQSALLEAMEERQVSIDGVKHELRSPFFVIATQNPIEMAGTYPLPEAQMDRFALKFSLGYISSEKEIEILSDKMSKDPLNTLEPVVAEEEIRQITELVKNIKVSEELKGYIVEIVRKTRSAEKVVLGASPRASLALMKIAQALALFDGYDFITPDHIKEIAVSVIAHRLVLDPAAKFTGITQESIVKKILKEVKVPV